MSVGRTFWIMTFWSFLHMNCSSLSPPNIGVYSDPLACSGNLRVEISDRLTCDIQLESSYIVSSSRALLTQVVSQTV
jgi:hypothetical protein